MISDSTHWWTFPAIADSWRVCWTQMVIKKLQVDVATRWCNEFADVLRRELRIWIWIAIKASASTSWCRNVTDRWLSCFNWVFARAYITSWIQCQSVLVSKLCFIVNVSLCSKYYRKCQCLSLNCLLCLLEVFLVLSLFNQWRCTSTVTDSLYLKS